MGKKKQPAVEDFYRAKGSGKFVKNPTFGESPPTANMDETVVGRAVDRLEASGGDCPVVAFYDPTSQLGALAHVSAEHAADDHHEWMIDGLLNAFELPVTAKVCVMMDLEGLGKEKADREAWLGRITDHLKSRGFAAVEVCTKGEGKYVTLDAETGRLLVDDGSGDTLLDTDLNDG